MGLECLLITCDSILLGQIKSAFSARAQSLELRQDAASAIELVRRRHLDGIVIDCDDVTGGTEAIAQVRTTRSNRDTPIIAVVNGLTSAGAALDLGANFVLCKPVQEPRLRSVLDVAFPRMKCERRRYFRYDADLPVRLQNHLEYPLTARMKNVSEDGMAIKLLDPVQFKGVVPVEFDIPQITPTTFHAKAEIVWSDSFEMGLRFLYIEKKSGIVFKSWLKLLQAQYQFHELAVSS